MGEYFDFISLKSGTFTRKVVFVCLLCLGLDAPSFLKLMCGQEMPG